MDRHTELALLDQCLELAREKRPFLSEEETLVPVSEYLDPARFEREREVLFRREPNLVAHASEIAEPGDFLTLDVVGTPAIITRDDAGRARAFVNVCRHRGATVELRERGHCKRFVCPYHAWTYGTDGQLAHVRHAEGFPSLRMADTRLVELSCSEQGGFIWVCPDAIVQPDATVQPDGVGDSLERVTSEIEGLFDEHLAAFASDTAEYAANWKLIVDGGLESYHFRIAHRDTIGSFFIDNASSYALVGDQIRSVLPRTSILELEDQPRETWRLRDHAHVLYSLQPNASVLTQKRHFELVLMTPLAPDRTRIRIVTVAPKPRAGDYSEKARAFLEANHAFTKKTLREDFVLAEQIQAGMATGANEHFRFARFEGALTAWHRRLDERLAAG